MLSCSPLPFSRWVKVTVCCCSTVSTGRGKAGRFGWFPCREWIPTMAHGLGRVWRSGQFYTHGRNFLTNTSKSTKPNNKYPRYTQWSFVRCLIWHLLHVLGQVHATGPFTALRCNWLTGCLMKMNGNSCQAMQVKHRNTLRFVLPKTPRTPYHGHKFFLLSRT